MDLEQIYQDAKAGLLTPEQMQECHDQIIIAAQTDGRKRPQKYPQKIKGHHNHHVKAAFHFEGGRKNPDANLPENLVFLTYGEHLLVHYLLAKLHGGKHSSAFHKLVHHRDIVTLAGFAECVAEGILLHSEVLKGNKYNLGRTHSKETRKKMSEVQKGRTISEEHRKKIGELKKGNTNMLGKTHSEETRKKIGAVLKGRTFSQETRERLREAQVKGTYIGTSLTDSSQIKLRGNSAIKSAGFNQGHVASCARGVFKQHKGYTWVYIPD